MKSAVESPRYSFLEEYNMTHEQFINEIAKYVQKYAPMYGIKVCSPIIAQACLEGQYGLSELSVNACNYFGLKYRPNRCPTSNGIYYKVGSEQNPDGSYVSSAMQWFRFPNMEDGVMGYFDFTNISSYSNLKGVTDPRTYLENIKADKYATSLNYVQNCMNVIESNNLTRFDTLQDRKYYRVQVGAYSQIQNAQAMQQKILNMNAIEPKSAFECIIKQYDSLYKCQCGAFSNKANAELLLESINKKYQQVYHTKLGAFITYC